MTKPPDAFLSYTRFDDQHERGKISEFRKRLADTVRAVTGEPFEIFQDVDDIAVGERWSGKLDGTIGRVSFFIPILTPSYFRSAACRDELTKFLAAEKARGRDDLILPIYYIECEVLEDPALRGADPLAKEICARQHYDWRELRRNSFSTKTIKTALERLARDISVARRRVLPVGPLAERVQALEQAAKEEFMETLRARAQENRRLLSAHLTGPMPALKAASEHSHNTSRTFEVGTVFRDIDASWCPEMVVIPPGEFMMGATKAEREARDTERPQHRVRIGYSLAVGRYPVTFEEYDHFAGASGRKRPYDEGWGRGRRPVINVSWNDVKAYALWLAGETDCPYRMLSEAEWEYVCRAGTTTRYWWGDRITLKHANYGRRDTGSTSEVGAYPANRFGLFDTHGNVWEWVEDVWHDSYGGAWPDSYNGAPTDGSAWLEGADAERVARGGSWDTDAAFLRSAYRSTIQPSLRYNLLGFRVARTLTNP